MLPFIRPIERHLYNEYKKDFYFLDKVDRSKIVTLVDIGANIGVSIEYFAQNLPGLKQVYGFEPDPETFLLLEKNAEYLMEKFGVKIELFKYGVYYGERLGHATGVDEYPAGYVLNHVDRNLLEEKWLGHWKDFSSHLWELRPIEELLGYDLAPDYLKMDCEGSEYNIIPNSHIVHNCRFLGIEFHKPDHDFNMEFMAKHLPKHRFVTKDVQNYLFVKD